MMMNSGPFDDGLYHPGVQHSGAAPAPQQPAFAPQQPAYAQPQPNYAQPQQQPQYRPQPQPAPQPQYTPNVPAYAPQQQPQPSFNSRPSGTQRITCGPSANCVPHNICPGDRLAQPGKVSCRLLFFLLSISVRTREVRGTPGEGGRSRYGFASISLPLRVVVPVGHKCHNKTLVVDMRGKNHNCLENNSICRTCMEKIRT